VLLLERHSQDVPIRPFKIFCGGSACAYWRSGDYLAERQRRACGLCERTASGRRSRSYAEVLRLTAGMWPGWHGWQPGRALIDLRFSHLRS
jgi:hypothetical protein